MPELALRILFVPVSGAFGMGEYARSLALARGAQQRWPEAAIHFVLSKAAPYAASTPFATTLLDASPTFHSAEVIGLIESLRPHWVIFDNAGRTAQLRAAQRSGARVIFISARARQRRKAFRWRWMRLLTEHWIAYPAFIAGNLKLAERFKLRVLKRPAVRYLDVILARGAGRSSDLLERVGVAAGSYVLVVPGGGTGHPRAMDAVARFQQAAAALAGQGQSVVFVGPDSGVGTAPPNLHCTGVLPQADLAALMGGARLVITNGGSTLLQAIACGCACVAIPIAGDQAERIRHCVSARVTVAARLDAGQIAETAARLLGDESARAGLARRASGLDLRDGVQTALTALAALL